MAGVVMENGGASVVCYVSFLNARCCPEFHMSAASTGPRNHLNNLESFSSNHT